VAQPTREEAIRTLRDGHDQLDSLAQALTDEDLTRPATMGGGEWSAKDILGHIATWEEVALRTLEEFRRGETPWIERDEGPFAAPATGRVDAFNARTVAEKQRRPLEQVRREAAGTHRGLVEAIRALTDEEWTAKASYPTPMNRRRRLVTLLGSVLGAPQRPFGHAFAHLPDLEAYITSLR
jgi:hypothetical protein